MPDRVVWALLAVAVFAEVNRSEKNTGSYYLSLGTEQFSICDWWGREKDFRPVADRYNKIRVKPIFYSERHSFLGRSSPGAAWRAIEVPLSQKCSAISLA